MIPAEAESCLRCGGPRGLPSIVAALTVRRGPCQRGGRTGSYRLDRLMARFGPDAALPDVLMALATCEHRRDFSQPCGARFADLTRQLTLPRWWTISNRLNNPRRCCCLYDRSADAFRGPAACPPTPAERRVAGRCRRST